MQSDKTSREDKEREEVYSPSEVAEKVAKVAEVAGGAVSALGAPGVGDATGAAASGVASGIGNLVELNKKLKKLQERTAYVCSCLEQRLQALGVPRNGAVVSATGATSETIKSMVHAQMIANAVITAATTVATVTATVLVPPAAPGVALAGSGLMKAANYRTEHTIADATDALTKMVDDLAMATSLEEVTGAAIKMGAGIDKVARDHHLSIPRGNEAAIIMDFIPDEELNRFVDAFVENGGVCEFNFGIRGSNRRISEAEQKARKIAGTRLMATERWTSFGLSEETKKTLLNTLPVDGLHFVIEALPHLPIENANDYNRVALEICQEVISHASQDHPTTAADVDKAVGIVVRRMMSPKAPGFVPGRVPQNLHHGVLTALKELEEKIGVTNKDTMEKIRKLAYEKQINFDEMSLLTHAAWLLNKDPNSFTELASNMELCLEAMDPVPVTPPANRAGKILQNVLSDKETAANEAKAEAKRDETSRVQQTQPTPQESVTVPLKRRSVGSVDQVREKEEVSPAAKPKRTAVSSTQYILQATSKKAHKEESKLPELLEPVSSVGETLKNTADALEMDVATGVLQSAGTVASTAEDLIELSKKEKKLKERAAYVCSCLKQRLQAEEVKRGNKAAVSATGAITKNIESMVSAQLIANLVIGLTTTAATVATSVVMAPVAPVVGLAGGAVKDAASFRTKSTMADMTTVLDTMVDDLAEATSLEDITRATVKLGMGIDKVAKTHHLDIPGGTEAAVIMDSLPDEEVDAFIETFVENGGMCELNFGARDGNRVVSSAEREILRRAGRKLVDTPGGVLYSLSEEMKKEMLDTLPVNGWYHVIGALNGSLGEAMRNGLLGEGVKNLDSVVHEVCAEVKSHASPDQPTTADDVKNAVERLTSKAEKPAIKMEVAKLAASGGMLFGLSEKTKTELIDTMPTMDELRRVMEALNRLPSEATKDLNKVVHEVCKEANAHVKPGYAATAADVDKALGVVTKKVTRHMPDLRSGVEATLEGLEKKIGNSEDMKEIRKLVREKRITLVEMSAITHAAWLISEDKNSFTELARNMNLYLRKIDPVPVDPPANRTDKVFQEVAREKAVAEVEVVEIEAP